MSDPLLVLVAICALAGIYVLFPIFWDVFKRYQKSKVVDCPNRKKQTSVQIDAKWAALTSISGYPTLRVSDCPLWKGEKDCHDECVSQL